MTTASAAEAAKAEILVTIGGESITARALNQAYRQLIRERYYHGNLPAEQVPVIKREAAQQLVDQKLIAQKARQQGLTVDNKAIKKQIKELDRGYDSQPGWKENRKEIMSLFKMELEEKALGQKLEAKVKESVNVSEDDVADYYGFNTEKFTTPERVSASIIVLGVAPFAASAEWQDALARGEALLKRLKKGESFAQLAEENSTHPSAELGGELGFLHQGMLNSQADEALKKLKKGEDSPVIRALEGAMILRLDDRIGAKLNDLDVVKERATALALRQANENAWNLYIEALRSETPVSLNEGLMGGGINEPPGE